MEKDNMKPYSKSDQLGYKVGTPEAEALLKRSRFKRKPRANKYGNKQEQYNGRTYDSITEADYARELDMRKLAKDIKDWTPQYVLKLHVNGQLVRRYAIDFRIEHNDGSIELSEVKGAYGRDWQLAWKLTKALLPAGEIPGVPKDARLTLVKRQGKKFLHQPQLLDYQ